MAKKGNKPSLASNDLEILRLQWQLFFKQNRDYIKEIQKKRDLTRILFKKLQVQTSLDINSKTQNIITKQGKYLLASAWRYACTKALANMPEPITIKLARIFAAWKIDARIRKSYKFCSTNHETPKHNSKNVSISLLFRVISNLFFSLSPSNKNIKATC